MGSQRLVLRCHCGTSTKRDTLFCTYWFGITAYNCKACGMQVSSKRMALRYELPKLSKLCLKLFTLTISSSCASYTCVCSCFYKFSRLFSVVLFLLFLWICQCFLLHNESAFACQMILRAGGLAVGLFHCAKLNSMVRHTGQTAGEVRRQTE